MKTPQQIVDECNELAATFYQMFGYIYREEFKFYKAHHPQEKTMWNLAVVAYDHIEGTDVEECLDEVESDE